MTIKHLRYLVYLLRHKYYVYREGRKLDLGRWRLLIHDASKFSRAEWRPYVETFYGTDPGSHKEAFGGAWLHHQRANPHHWQHWILRLDDGKGAALRMPETFAREMVADWTAMGRAFGEPDAPRGWYAKNARRMMLHPETRAFVEQLLFGKVSGRTKGHA